MKIGLRGGHSNKVQGAVGIVNEYEQMQKFYNHASKLLTEYGHTVVDCNSNASTQANELAEGARRANDANVDLFISLHMNSYDGNAYGTECYIASTSSGSYKYAKNICENFEALGFKNRGVKVKSYYEMKNIKAPNIIFEICFCDSKRDIDIYNKYSWEQLAHKLCSAIDNNIPNVPEEKKAYIITKYLPHAYEGYDGVDIRAVIDKYFEGVKCYVRGDTNGVWIETEYLNVRRCIELKKKVSSVYYEIKTFE
ncbi:N-acetylmuramoyl-L-alanine amidase [Clostridium butyricum]|uniref:N-acetylmuramoyl-L-alanine amidase n=1 Tax=Clostridium butyricum TaxID=1492 RepID=UPI00374E86BC